MKIQMIKGDGVMSGKNRTSVRIGTGEYTLVGSESNEYMRQVAIFIDKKMTEVTKKNPRMNATTAAILASVNVADDFFKSVKAETELTAKYEEASNMIDRLKAEVLQLNREVEFLNNKNSSLVVELARKEVELGEIKGDIEKNSRIRFYSK